ncbi:MAG: gliding motility-associated C-terminal domain-containing protein [Bacteroidia bacterium]|nr:gliding motility-associated C-terminal domain-containing protein [Bacteroidia bacterium]
MKNTLHILLLSLFCTIANAQQREREVISTSAGVSTNALVSYTIGEAVIGLGAMEGTTLTQGFEQPSLLELARSNKFNFKLDTIATSCNGINDGIAFVTPYNLTGTYKVLWYNESTKDTIYNLAPNTYSVIVTSYGADTNTITKKFTILKGEKECEVDEHNVITPNGDNKNDIFYIKGIELYKDNQVYIYNRWGGLEWEGKNYDNTSVVFTGINTKGGEIPSGTYFYKISYTDLRGQTRTIKNWLELIR